MIIEVLKKTYAVCRLNKAALPDGEFVSLTMSGGEISLVCEETKMPCGCRSETGWRALRVKGPLDFSLKGILADLSGVLARAGVSIFALSTYDTDYIFVKQVRLEDAKNALTTHGHTVIENA